jgi:hypothetical protein
VNNAVARLAGLLSVALLPLVGGGSMIGAGLPQAMAVSAALCVLGALCLGDRGAPRMR